MGRDRSWVVRITTAECAVELRCSAGGFCSVVLQCGFAVGCEDSEDTGFCPLRIMWCAPEHQYPQKTLNYKAFWGVFLFSGYKLATFAAIFVARGSWRDAVKLSGYLHQQAGVAVTNVVHPDALYPRCLAAILHFVIQKALGVGKEPVVLLQPVAMGHILL